MHKIMSVSFEFQTPSYDVTAIGAPTTASFCLKYASITSEKSIKRVEVKVEINTAARKLCVFTTKKKGKHEPDHEKVPLADIGAITMGVVRLSPKQM